MRRPRSGRLPFFGERFEREGNRRGGGNVEIWQGLPDFQGTVERVENPVLVFHSFHGPGISTAWAPFGHKKRGGGNGDSILQARNNRALAALILRAHSVSLMVAARRSSCFSWIPSLR